MTPVENEKMKKKRIQVLLPQDIQELERIYRIMVWVKQCLSHFEVRWAYGPEYGIYGSMWIEKMNGSTDARGPCYLHNRNFLPVMKKY